MDNTTQQKRLTASERESLLRINIAADIMTRDGKALWERAKLIPGARRDMGMLAAKAVRLLEEFTETIPDDQLMAWKRTLEGRSYSIGCKGPATPKQNTRDYGMWIAFDVLNTILDGLHDHCMMCNLDKTGRRKCPLRKALDNIPNDTKERGDGDCQYYTVI